MNKRAFKSTIINQIKELPFKKRITALLTMESVIKEIRKKLSETIKRDYIYCDKCKDYYPRKNIKTDLKEKIEHDVCVYRDAGYGDDDMYADVTYLYEYYICPKCKNNIVKDRYYVKEINRHRR